jgi:hypothetical protein
MSLKMLYKSKIKILLIKPYQIWFFFGLIKRLENGTYYIQSSNKKFKNLKPSMNERLQVIP